jgi:TPR repeat protein
MYGKAASYNYPQAQIKLCEMYFHGHGVPIDFVEAYRWYVKQCNDPTSQYHLAMLFSAVEHPMYISKARMWFQCSAEGGNVEAQYKAGLLILRRRNIPNNKQNALRYFSMTTTADHAKAAK